MTDDVRNLRVEMFRAMRELLGPGYVPLYYEQCAQPFIDIAQDYAVKALAPYQWRPISEAHEDYGTVVLCTTDDPGDARLSHPLDDNWDEVSEGMTHFARVPAFRVPPEETK